MPHDAIINHYNPIILATYLQQIPIIRTQIPQLRLLKLRHPQIRHRLIPRPILCQHRNRIQTTRRAAQTRETNTDRISPFEMRRILRQKRICGDDAADVAEAHLPRRADGAAVVAAEVEVEPADGDGQGGVGAHGHEEEGAVLEVGVCVRGEEDGEAGDGHADGDEGEEEAVLEPVGEEGDDEGEDEGCGPGWDGVQLRADLCVAVGFYDARGEEGVAVGGDDEPEVHEGAEEELVVFEAVEDIARGDLALAGGAALVFLEAGADVSAFVFSEPAWWDIRGGVL